MSFRGGRNIAMKTPPHLVGALLRFYGETLGLEPWPEEGESPSFRFGANRLWIDSVPGLSQPELWLEVITSDTEEASRHLDAHGVVRCDEIEPLPEGFRGFWVAAPGGMVHLVAEEE